MLGSAKTGNRSLTPFSVGLGQNWKSFPDPVFDPVFTFSRMGLGGSGTPVFDADFAP
jgi:hypothetical protein